MTVVGRCRSLFAVCCLLVVGCGRPSWSFVGYCVLFVYMFGCVRLLYFVKDCLLLYVGAGCCMMALLLFVV